MAERWAKEGARILHLYNLLAMHVGNNNDIDQCCDGAAVAGAAQLRHAKLHGVLTREDGTILTYIVLAKFTDQGIRNAKESPKRAEAFKQLAKTFGVTVKDIFWTQGRYDTVTIVEAPDESSAMSLSLSLGALGNVRTESLRAFSAADMATIVGKMV
jgi:uncharacterized protein with GYD domain